MKGYLLWNAFLFCWARNDIMYTVQGAEQNILWSASFRVWLLAAVVFYLHLFPWLRLLHQARARKWRVWVPRQRNPARGICDTGLRETAMSAEHPPTDQFSRLHLYISL